MRVDKVGSQIRVIYKGDGFQVLAKVRNRFYAMSKLTYIFMPSNLIQKRRIE